jgi:hypothetical protein
MSATRSKSRRRRNMLGGERQRGVSHLGTGDVERRRLWNKHHATIAFVGIVDRKLCGHAGPRLDAKIEIVLMQVLPACPGWLEVEHG